MRIDVIIESDKSADDFTRLGQLAEDVGLSLRGAETARGLLEESSAAGFSNVYFPALLNIVDGKVEGEE